MITSEELARRRNAWHQRQWRARHPEHREKQRLYMQKWRAERRLNGIKERMSEGV